MGAGACIMVGFLDDAVVVGIIEGFINLSGVGVVLISVIFEKNKLHFVFMYLCFPYIWIYYIFFYEKGFNLINKIKVNACCIILRKTRCVGTT
jgi:hypothetical protein